MNRTKQSVLNDLITLMNATQDAAITSIEVAETDRPQSYHRPSPRGRFPQIRV